jgi:hypothetical protein
MATERQIAANRRNARQSTGPRTVPGKKRSSQNAYRHGLRSQLSATESELEEIEKISRMFASESTSPPVLDKARTAAEATFHIARIGRVRATLVELVAHHLRVSIAVHTVASPKTRRLSRWLGTALLSEAPGHHGPASLSVQDGERTSEAMRRLLPQVRILAGYEWRAWSRRERAFRALSKSDELNRLRRENRLFNL